MQTAAGVSRSHPEYTVALVGLGATGVAIGRALLQRSDCRLVAALDTDPAKGDDLGDLLGDAEISVPVVTRVDEIPEWKIDVAVVATTSALEELLPVAIPLLQKQINVVSICEELAYPYRSHPQAAARLNDVSAQHGVTIIGTGCNPGFVMDTLPLVLSGVTWGTRQMEIHRTADMSRYAAIVSKFGLGLTTEEFTTAQAAGNVVGHVGFEQAIAALAAGLEWRLDGIQVDPVRPALTAPDARPGVHVTIQAGTIAAVVHAARGYCGQQTLIELSIHFGFFRKGDPIAPGDTYRIIGEEQTIDVTAEHGFESFLSTVSMAANVTTAVVKALPGLRTMDELPIGAIASRSPHMRRNG